MKELGDMRTTYYEKLQNINLVRNGEYRYTTEDKELDEFFGLNKQFYLLPDANKIVELASYNFLFAILGYRMTAVTSTKEGYIASYSDKSGKHFGTFSTGMMFSEEYILKKIVAAYKKEIRNISFKGALSIDYSQQDRISSKATGVSLPKEVVDKLNLYGKVLSILSQDKTLLTRCCLISGSIEDKESIDFSSFDEVNLNNCSDNHRILCKFICGSNEELYKYLDNYICSKESWKKMDFDESSVPDELKKSFDAAKTIFDSIYDSIIDGYQKYFGKHKNADGNAEIYNLADSELFDTYLPLLTSYVNENYPDCKDKTGKVMQVFRDILNMCKTDYSIDVVLWVMEKIKNITDEFLLPDAATKSDQRDELNRKFVEMALNRAENLAAVFGQTVSGGSIQI